MLLYDCSFYSLRSGEAGREWEERLTRNVHHAGGAFGPSLRRIPNWTALPPMPADSGTWSALHSWSSY